MVTVLQRIGNRCKTLPRIEIGKESVAAVVSINPAHYGVDSRELANACRRADPRRARRPPSRCGRCPPPYIRPHTCSPLVFLSHCPRQSREGSHGNRTRRKREPVDHVLRGSSAERFRGTFAGWF